MNKQQFIERVRTQYGATVADKFSASVASNDDGKSWFDVLRNVAETVGGDQIKSYQELRQKPCDAIKTVRREKVDRRLIEKMKSL